MAIRETNANFSLVCMHVVYMHPLQVNTMKTLKDVWDLFTKVCLVQYLKVYTSSQAYTHVCLYKY